MRPDRKHVIVTKRFLALVFSATLTFSIFPTFLATSQGADLTTCGGGGATNRLDPPLNPNGQLSNGMALGSTPLTGFKASKASPTSVYATWDDWNPGNVGALSTYYLYASSDGGVTWSCTRSYAHSAQIDGVSAGKEIQAILLASKGDTWAKSAVIRVAIVNPSSQICIPHNYVFSIKYDAQINGFFAVMMPEASSLFPAADDSNSKSAGQVETQESEWTLQQAQFLNYTFEVSIDNWKTKVIGKDQLGSTVHPLGHGVWLKPLSTKNLHQFRAIPILSKDQSSSFTTAGCPARTASLYPVAKKPDPCAVSVLDPKCKQDVVAGENADTSAQPTPKATLKASTKTTSIICVSGASKATISGRNPKCPPGYKKKS